MCSKRPQPPAFGYRQPFCHGLRSFQAHKREGANSTLRNNGCLIVSDIHAHGRHTGGKCRIRVKENRSFSYLGINYSWHRCPFVKMRVIQWLSYTVDHTSCPFLSFSLYDKIPSAIQSCLHVSLSYPNENEDLVMLPSDHSGLFLCVLHSRTWRWGTKIPHS